MKKLLFIINPMAGRQQAQTDLYKMVKIFADHDYEVTVYPTRARLDCTRKVLEDAGRFDLVVCCGGDGTLNEVVNGAAGFDNAAVTCIPIGTGNDFLKNFGPDAAKFTDAENLWDGEVHPLDLIRGGSRPAGRHRQ